MKHDTDVYLDFLEKQLADYDKIVMPEVKWRAACAGMQYAEHMHLEKHLRDRVAELEAENKRLKTFIKAADILLMSE